MIIGEAHVYSIKYQPTDADLGKAQDYSKWGSWASFPESTK